MDTIYALATASGKAGVSIVRVSGPRATECLAKLCKHTVPLNRAVLRKLYSRDGGVIDQALILRFDSGHSFTGEEVVEFQLHGSPAIVSALYAELSLIGRYRLAEPGEFTRRALENEQLDLSQVEGLADLIDAETESQRKQALRVFEGHLGKLVKAWRQDLIRASALLEATIDFVDEEVPVDVTPEVLGLISSVKSDLLCEISGAEAAERIRNGFEVAIVGAPNVGKSTLLNRLAGRQAAITSEFAGTTRDIIEVRMDLMGLPVVFLDTAGIRDSSDNVEKIGIELAKSRAARADIRVFLLENSDSKTSIDLRDGDITVISKCDLNSEQGGISGLTGAGVTDLLQRIVRSLEDRAREASLAIRERHKQAYGSAIDALNQAENILSDTSEMTEFASEFLRRAMRELDSLIGRIDVEDVLDEIFSSFCLGK